MDNTPFYYDEFFVPEDDPGEEVILRLRGRDVPIRVKRNVTLEDIEAAKERAVRKHFDPARGGVVIDHIDEAAFALEVFTRMLKSWPFTTRDGQPVPIDRKHVAALIAEADGQLDAIVQRFLQRQEMNVAPLGKPSAPPSANRTARTKPSSRQAALPSAPTVTVSSDGMQSK